MPTGRGSDIDLISAEEFEQVFDKLYQTSQRVLFDIKSTEAQHYRRYLLQRRTEAKRRGEQAPAIFNRFPQFSQMPVGGETPDGIGRAPRGINDGKGFVFISHLGEVYPSGFLPVVGRQREAAIAVRHLPRIAAVSLAARQQESEGQVRRVRISRNLRRLARPLLRHDRRHVCRGTLLRLSTESHASRDNQELTGPAVLFLPAGRGLLFCSGVDRHGIRQRPHPGHAPSHGQANHAA